MSSLVGCCLFTKELSGAYESARLQRIYNKEINRELKKEKKRLRRRQLILLLGTGESGKSTFLKQMKIINGKRFSNEELNQLKDVIYDNIYKGVLFLLQARENLGISWSIGEDSLAAQSGRELEIHFETTRMKRRERGRLAQPLWSVDEFLDIVPALRAVWEDKSIRTTFNQRAKIITENFSENVRYYLNKLHIIGVKTYCPTDEDIVWTRKPTESIVEEEIKVHNASFVFIDIGGQTKERPKWFQFFSNMTSVLFLIACSHYDEHYQDKVTKEFRNKLHEAMIVFEGLINHIAFRNVSVIIFFNKTDILKEKLSTRQTNIRDEFPNYPKKYDPFALQCVQTFMVEAFASLINHNLALDLPGQTHGANRASLSGPSMDRATNGVNVTAGGRSSESRISRFLTSTNQPPIIPMRKRMIYRHFTTAIDRENIETVFIAMQDTVLQNNLRRIMMS